MQKSHEDYAICSNMNGPRDCHIEWSKSEKEKCLWHPLYAVSKKKWHKWTNLQNGLTDLVKENLQLPGGKDQGKG